MTELDNTQLGHYRLIEAIGHGGMSTVYKAYQESLDRYVAVKVLLSNRDPQFTARFKREARAIAALQHHNILPIYDYGEQDGLTYLVMQYIEGSATLADRVGSPLPPAVTLRLIGQLLGALEYAHQHGIVHRDIKPANVLMPSGDWPLLSDFGIARLVNESQHLTMANEIIGTPTYMAPEQAAGGPIDARTDLYAVGAVLFELLTGHVPFKADTPMSVLVKHMYEPPPSPRLLVPELPDEVESIVLCALAKDPNQRFQSAAAMAADLERVAAGLSGTGVSTHTQASDQGSLPVQKPTVAIQSPINATTPIQAEPSKPRPTTVHLQPIERPAQSRPDTIKLVPAIQHSDEQVFEELVLHKDYERIWRAIAFARGGRYLLSGYGAFGGTSLMRCALAKARAELSKAGAQSDALLAIHVRIVNETPSSFEVEADTISVGQPANQPALHTNADWNALQRRASAEQPAGAARIDLALDDPLGKTLFHTGATGDPYQTILYDYDFARFTTDLNSFFEQRQDHQAFYRLVARLVRSHDLQSRLVIIIDKIQHIETLEALAASALFANPRVMAFVITRQETFDHWTDARRRLKQVGFSPWYVPCLWKIDMDASLFAAAAQQDSNAEKHRQIFRKYLEYQGRGSLVRIIAQLKQPHIVSYGAQTSFVDIGDLAVRADIAHDAWMQDLLDHNWSTIFADNLGSQRYDERLDRAKIGVYYLIDWLADQLRFTRRQALDAAQQLPVTVAEDPGARDAIVQSLLDVLSQISYLKSDGTTYRCIWRKDRPPRVRTVTLKREKIARPMPTPASTKDAPPVEPPAVPQLAPALSPLPPELPRTDRATVLLPKPNFINYLDFDLEISGSGDTYSVAVLHSPAGEARGTLHFPFDRLELDSHLKSLQIALLRSGSQRRADEAGPEIEVQEFGRSLFEAVFNGDIRSRYQMSQHQAVQQGYGLRLKLRIQPPELAVLPWEYLYDPQRSDYICLSRATPIVRYIDLPQAPVPLAITPPLRVLCIISAPRDLAPLNIEREKQRLELALETLRIHNQVELTWLEQPTRIDLQRAMRGGPWHVLHFMGHGGFNRSSGQGFLALIDDDENAYRLMALDAGRLLADHPSLRLVLLNACEGARSSLRDIFSSTAATLVRRGVPAVLAMQNEITDFAAVELARAFYAALADGLPVDAAVAEARKHVSSLAANSVEWGIPVLFMRAPDGILFGKPL
jgi:serine/threonine protein kinase